MIMGIVEIVAGALILLGLLRTNRGFVARLLGGITLVAFGIFFVTMRSVGGYISMRGVCTSRLP